MSRAATLFFVDTRVYLRALVVWFGIIAGETLHGVFRGLILVPLMGDLTARQICVVIGSLIILAVSYLTVIWIGAAARLQLITVGIVWVTLTVSFEVLLGRVLLGLDWNRILSDYDIGRGGFMPFGLLFMAASPLIAFWLRSR